ncbi:hypothetical protein CRUP_026645 [Coryphaenoides rupestris]|nr:hypothetical protein CRUP_026645 [Coryphaenoides rupestris]
MRCHPSALHNYYGTTAAAAAAAVKLASLALIICVGVAGNGALSVALLRDASLHKAPYVFLLDLCVADALRSAVCLPFVAASVHRGGSAWPHGALRCRLLAVLSALLCFHGALLLLCVSVTRYLAIAHHRFYATRVNACVCGALVCAAWTLSAAAALPPVFGAYAFAREEEEEEEQCGFEHRHLRANDTPGFVLTLAAVVSATHAVYVKTLCFVYDHRKMKPAQPVPAAVSQNWTFHGPGASGQAAANWIAGFGRGPTPPTLVGVRQAASSSSSSSSSSSHHGGARRLLVLDEFKMEKRIGRMYYMMTLSFLVLWAPYLATCCVRIFVKGAAVPQVYLTAAVWMTFVQAGVNPIISLVFNKELRLRLRACFPWCLGTQTPMEPYYVI